MFALNEESGGELTVFNEGDGAYLDDDINEYKLRQDFLGMVAPCCSNPDESEAYKNCEFVKNCSKNFKLFQRRLLLGEPLETDNHLGDGFDVWENALKYAVGIATSKFQIEPEELEEAKEDFWLRIATLLRIFIQLNFTGPEEITSRKSVQEQLERLTTLSQDPVIETIIKDTLELEGIELDPNTRQPILLVVVKQLLPLPVHTSPKHASPFYLHWRFRVDFLHQKMLQRRCVPLSLNAKGCASTYLRWRKKEHHLDEGLKEVDASFMLEIAEMLTYYYDGLLATRFLEEAKKVLGLEVNFSGKMGFRTKFQQTAKPQTIVDVVVAEKQGEKSPFPGLEEFIPKSLALDDDTRLERVRLIEPDVEEEQSGHAGIHQLVVLGMMNHKVAFQKHEDLTLQEVQALVNTVIDNPVSWNGRVSAMIARCQMEKTDRRAIDRSLRQLEDLVKTIWQKDESSSDETTEWNKVALRQYLFFSSGIPSRSDLKIVFAEVLESIDHWKEALGIYEEIGCWEKIIHCYKMLKLRHKAESLIREKMEVDGETPKLLVLLGDATSDISHYEKAWTVSGGKSYTSRIRIGDHYFYRQEYELAKPYLKEAIALAPLDYPCCLKLAWACYKTEDYGPAFSAYLKAANLEYDNFQVWSNLATCAIKLGRKEFALRAYQLAVKCNYDEWRIWCNMLVVAVELGEINQAIQAYHRILELNKDWGDNEVLRMLIGKVVVAGGGVKLKMAELMGRITSQNARGPFPWLLYGRLLASYLDSSDEEINVKLKMSSFERSLGYYSKALTLMRQNPRWKTEVGMMTNVVACIIEFRYQRCRELPQDQELTQDHKAFDCSLRETAKSVYAVVTSFVNANSSDSELKELMEEMKEEISDPFYNIS